MVSGPAIFKFYAGCAVVFIVPLMMCAGCLTVFSPSQEQIAAEAAEASASQMAEDILNKKQQAAEDALAKEEQAVEDARPKMNKKNYDRIYTGMSYGDVIAIVGSPDSKVSHSSFSGSTSSVYEWKTGIFGLGSATIQFLDNRVVIVSQSNL